MLLRGDEIGRHGSSATGLSNPTLASAQKHCGVGAPDRIRTCGLYLRRVALYPAELRVPVTWNYSPVIILVNDTLTRLSPARVADHLMAIYLPAPTPEFSPRWLQCGCNASCQRRSKNFSVSNLFNSLPKSTHKTQPSLDTLAFGGQRSIQLSYGCAVGQR